MDFPSGHVTIRKDDITLVLRGVGFVYTGDLSLTGEFDLEGSQALPLEQIPKTFGK